jgi:beta-aspartyl-peptidase (threonine type)
LGDYNLRIKYIFNSLLLAFLLISSLSAQNKNYGMVIHGGAGSIIKSEIPPEIEKQFKEKLREALLAGKEILKNNGTSLDAVEAAVKIMEDSPLFNAGKGAVYNSKGKIELDASIMDGKILNAGAAAGVMHIKNPISLARMIMEKSGHVFLAGKGAEDFAESQGMNLVSEDYFYTESRWKSYQRAKEIERQDSIRKNSDSLKLHNNISTDKKFGTVGAVALDMQGNLAAGTSTGGTSYKKFGRIGDSPIIGAGTYANNKTCAVSCTGTGEYFIRSVAAYDISALMEYKGLSIKEAAEHVIEKIGELGGNGGVIAIDKNGDIAMPFNTQGMFRAYIDEDGNPVVKMYKEE